MARRRRKRKSPDSTRDGENTRDDRPMRGAPASTIELPDDQLREIFTPDKSFADLGLNANLLEAVEKRGFIYPTKVQADLIPAALSGRDVLGQSKTGTGKTAAFGLPILQMIQESDAFGALVLVPTRELAIQVCHEIRELSRYTNLKTLAVYGGQRISVQAEKLRKNPQVVVGTPGRVMDMHGRGTLPYEKVKIAVLDEVDRMLDIGFREDIRRILGVMRQKHQTIFVSATISDEIERLSRQYMKNPLRLEVSQSQSLTVAQVNQKHFAVQPWDKYRLLLHLLTHEEPTLTLIFCRTKQTCDALTVYLNRKGIDAHAMHADLHQGKRNRVMKKLRDGELSVLVASDLAARGLDVDDITHVINYDLPEDPEVYIHRIGRTARTGRNGIAWAFVTPEQGDLLTAIEMLTNVEIPLEDYSDFTPGPVPREIAARTEMQAARQAEVRSKKQQGLTPPSKSEIRDEQRFPGGIVPVALPSKRMRGRVKRRR